MKKESQVKSALALVASESNVIRAWASFGMIHAATHDGLFSFHSLDAIRHWIASKP